jgi:hypothetical protein
MYFYHATETSYLSSYTWRVIRGLNGFEPHLKNPVDFPFAQEQNPPAVTMRDSGH